MIAYPSLVDLNITRLRAVLVQSWSDMGVIRDGEDTVNEEEREVFGCGMIYGKHLESRIAPSRISLAFYTNRTQTLRLSAQYNPLLPINDNCGAIISIIALSTDSHTQTSHIAVGHSRIPGSSTHRAAKVSI